MLGVTFQGEKSVAVELVDIPQIVDESDAIVRTSLVGVCGSDLHCYNIRETGCKSGTIMGHEMVGVITALGKQAANELSIGDRVACAFTTSCGHCWQCTHRLPCRCKEGQLLGWINHNGKGLHGAQAQYVRVPLAPGTLLKLPDHVSDEQGLLLGDILSTGWFCAENAGLQDYSDAILVVVGCGPVGLMTVAAAMHLTQAKCKGKLYAVDSIPERLALAEEFGASVIDRSIQNPKEIIDKVTNGEGADVVMEVVGLQAAFDLAIDLLRPGGVISSVGAHTSAILKLSQAYDKNISLKIGRCPARYFMNKILPLIQSKNVGFDITKIITHRMSIKDASEAYKIFDQKLDKCVKVVLDPTV